MYRYKCRSVRYEYLMYEYILYMHCKTTVCRAKGRDPLKHNIIILL